MKALKFLLLLPIIALLVGCGGGENLRATTQSVWARAAPAACITLTARNSPS